MCSQFINEPSPGPGTAVRQNRINGSTHTHTRRWRQRLRWCWWRWWWRYGVLWYKQIYIRSMASRQHVTRVCKNWVLTLHVTVFTRMLRTVNMLFGTPPMVFRATMYATTNVWWCACVWACSTGIPYGWVCTMCVRFQPHDNVTPNVIWWCLWI